MKNVTIDDAIYCAEVSLGCRSCSDCRFANTNRKNCDAVEKLILKILKDHKEKVEPAWKKSMLARFLKSE